MLKDPNEMSREAAIHIVDDDANVRDALSLLMFTADLKAQAFPTAEALLEAVDLEKPCCLLLDVRLPGLSGLDLLAHHLHQRGKAAVIVITGHGDVPMAVRAMKAGAYHFVQKPFDPEELLELVEEALRHIEDQTESEAINSEVTDSYQSLTPREQQVMTLLVEGLPNKLVATRLGISTRTTEHHRAAVMRKMKARTLSHLVRMAISMSRGKQGTA
jgi:two-component system response regulator FixJ